MRWFVPTQGDSMFLGVQAKSLDDLKTQEQRLSALTGRVHRMAANEREARAVGRHLAEMGVLMEPPGSLHELKVMVLDDPMFAEWAMAMGLDSPYRPALPDEIKELESLSLGMWPLRLHEGGMI